MTPEQKAALERTSQGIFELHAEGLHPNSQEHIDYQFLLNEMEKAANWDAIEPMLKELVQARDKATPKDWYKIGLPWNNHTPYICAGHYDPHVGEAIIDVMEQDMFQETDDMTLEEVEQQYEAYQHSNCDFICKAANTMSKIKEIIGE